MDSSYQEEQLNDGRVRFTVTPASTPAMGRKPTALDFVLWGPFAFIGQKMAASKTESLRPNVGGTFIVSPEGIDINGEFVSVSRLHRLILRNDFISEGGANSVIVYNPASIGSSLAAATENVRAKRHNEAAAVSYMLCVEYGGRSTTLAGGMTEITAYGLMQDVGRILQL